MYSKLALVTSEKKVCARQLSLLVLVTGNPLTFCGREVSENPQTRKWAKKVYRGKEVQLLQLT